MSFLTKEQEQKFKIVCNCCMPEYMLRVDDGNIINTILTNSKSDMFSSLYRYESEYVNFIFSRIHYYIVAWFEDNSARIYKGNRYLTSGSRGDIQNFINIFNQFHGFFEKNSYEFEIEPKYLSKIQEISEFVYTNNDQKFRMFQCLINIFCKIAGKR